MRVAVELPAATDGQLIDIAALERFSDVERRGRLVQPGVAQRSRAEKSNRAADVLVTLGLREGVIKAGEQTLGHASAHFHGDRVIPGFPVVVDQEAAIAGTKVIKLHRIDHKEIRGQTGCAGIYHVWHPGTRGVTPLSQNAGDANRL